MLVIPAAATQHFRQLQQAVEHRFVLRLERRVPSNPAVCPVFCGGVHRIESAAYAREPLCRKALRGSAPFLPHLERRS
jgi:hypothetical protein